MSIKPTSSKPQPSAPVEGRNIHFGGDDEDSAAQNPYQYGFSTGWMESVQIPEPVIDYAKPDAALKIYGDFLKELFRFHDANLGFQRWIVGTILNRLKPITGDKSAKQIPHGQFAKFVEGRGWTPDLVEESRWVAATWDRGAAQTMNWTSLRKAALEKRRAKHFYNRSMGQLHGKTRSASQPVKPARAAVALQTKRNKQATYALPEVERHVKENIKYFKEALKRLPTRGRLKGEGVEALPTACDELASTLTKIGERIRALSSKKPKDDGYAMPNTLVRV